MPALKLFFQGFFQCRLTTDPDDYTHPRGEHGWTFAFDGEPDLDRVIRFWNAVSLRSHAPSIGVSVVAVTVDNTPAAAHGLRGARVELAPDACFEGRSVSGVKLTPDGKEPISPMRVRISKDAAIIERRSDYDVMVAAQRRPFMGKGFGSVQPDPTVRGSVLATPQDALRYRAQRAADLRAELDVTTDPVARAAISARLNQLQPTGGDDVRVATLIGAVQYDHTLKDAATYSDPAGILGGVPDAASPWPINYWMGSWDADTLTGYVRGSLVVPIT